MKSIAGDIASAPLKLLTASLLLFALTRPVDPTAGQGGSIFTDYAIWIGHAARGDFGTSIGLRRPVLPLIGEALQDTLEVAAGAFAIAAALGLGGGLFWFARREDKAGRLVDVGTAIALSAPNFLWALLFILLFGSRFSPAALGLAFAPAIMRAAHASLVEAYRDNSITHERLKGVSERRIFWRNAIRLAAAPALAAMRARIGGLLGGTLAIEAIFSRSGLGALMLDAMRYADAPVILAAALAYCAMALAARTVFDILRAALDPRLRG